ncbi:hypothetical protein ACVME8_005817 [Bradyrhizobium diazoefficiens]
MLLGPLQRLIRFGLPHKADDFDQLFPGGLCAANHEVLNGFGAPILQLVPRGSLQIPPGVVSQIPARVWRSRISIVVV